jgi:hypothetical protein
VNLLQALIEPEAACAARPRVVTGSAGTLLAIFNLVLHPDQRKHCSAHAMQEPEHADVVRRSGDLAYDVGMIIADHADLDVVEAIYIDELDPHASPFLVCQLSVFVTINLYGMVTRSRGR